MTVEQHILYFSKSFVYWQFQLQRTHILHPSSQQFPPVCLSGLRQWAYLRFSFFHIFLKSLFFPSLDNLGLKFSYKKNNKSVEHDIL